jgi:hypothetical protein
VGILVWFWLRDVIMSAEPWNWNEYGKPNEPYPDWFLGTRERFLRSILPMVGVMAISTIFLIRGFSGNIQFFSRLGNFVLAWPLVDFLPLSLLGLLSIYCLPIGFILALIPSVICFIKKENYGDLIAIPLSIVWILVAMDYSIHLESLTGD